MLLTNKYQFRYVIDMRIELNSCTFFYNDATVTIFETKNKNRAAGTMISLSCVTSEYIVDGSSRITCQSDRSWEPNIPKCRRVYLILCFVVVFDNLF